MRSQPGHRRAGPGLISLFLLYKNRNRPSTQVGWKEEAQRALVCGKKRGSREMRLVSFITVLQIECARVGMIQSYLAAHQPLAVDWRTSVSNRPRDRRAPCTIMGPFTLWASILEPSDGRVKSIGSGESWFLDS